MRDIDYVTYDIGELKTAVSKRELPIPQALYEALLPFKGMPDRYIFTTDGTSFLSNSTYGRYWRSLMGAMYDADQTLEYKVLEKGEHISILTAHYFRHNYATVLYNAEVDVLTAQKYLGHADIETTLGVYTELKNIQESRSAARLKTVFDEISERKKSVAVAKRLPGDEKVLDFGMLKQSKKP